MSIASELFDRWPQENYLKYMMEEFALDHLHAYGAEEIVTIPDHPNPEYCKLHKELSAINDAVKKAIGHQTLNRIESSKNAFAKLQTKLHHITIKGIGTVKQGIEKIAQLKSLLATIKERVSAHDYKRLAHESRMFHNFLKMSAYQLEGELVDILREHYKDLHGDSRSIIASMLKSSGTLRVEQGRLMVTLTTQSSPQRTRLLQCLCDHLNKKEALYPGSNLVLRFQVQM